MFEFAFTEKQINGEKDVLNFPVWEVRNFDLKEVIKVKADSIGFDADVLMAYFNGSKERLVAPSTNEFIRRDQKSSGKTDGYMLTHLERSNKWSVVNTEGNQIIFGKDSIYRDAPFFYIFSKPIKINTSKNKQCSNHKIE